MAHYTIELRKLIYYYGLPEIESWFSDYELSDYLTESQIQTIENAGIWSKEKLATNIVEWYYMREIGLETPALFEHYAKATMKRVMEKYLPVIYSKCLNYNPLHNIELSETLEKEGEESGSNSSSNSSSSSSSASSLTIGSDTPQGQITKENILNGTYASSTSANESEGSSEDSSSSESEGTLSKSESYTKNINGKDSRKSYQELIKEYRDNIVDINSKIISELDSLFMGLYM